VHRNHDGGYGSRSPQRYGYYISPVTSAMIND
jgi:hypothetical protein